MSHREGQVMTALSKEQTLQRKLARRLNGKGCKR